MCAQNVRWGGNCSPLNGAYIYHVRKDRQKVVAHVRLYLCVFLDYLPIYTKDYVVTDVGDCAQTHTIAFLWTVISFLR